MSERPKRKGQVSPSPPWGLSPLVPEPRSLSCGAAQEGRLQLTYNRGLTAGLEQEIYQQENKQIRAAFQLATISSYTDNASVKPHHYCVRNPALPPS